MNTEQIRSSYKRNLKEILTVRRYTGTGTNPPHFEVTVRGKARLYGSTELIGTITQGDWNVILLVDDLIANRFALPLTTNDKIVIAGKQVGILAANTRKAPDGTIVAYDCQAR